MASCIPPNHVGYEYKDFLEPLRISDNCLEQLALDFSHTYRDLARNSTEQFLATPINNLPKGDEEGKFLAVDVGGTNLRVGFVELLGKHAGRWDRRIRRSYERSWYIKDHFKMDNAEELFSWIGSCIALVVADYLTSSDKQNAATLVIPLGITFSFPMLQSSIDEATLMPMGKGFAISSELDLRRMLLKGYSQHVRNGEIPRPEQTNGHSMPDRLPDLRIVAITNDTVATLASLSYSARALPSSRVAMGLVVGTGTNASIVLKLDDLHPQKKDSIILPDHTDRERAHIIVNTEWTINGAAPPLHRAGLVSRWDEVLDRNCEAPGFQPFETMAAGRYLGELARLVLHDHLVNVQGVPKGHLPNFLVERNALPTAFLSTTVATCDDSTALLQWIDKEPRSPQYEWWHWDHHSADLLIATTRALRLRSARMIAAAVVGLLVSAGDLQWKDSDANIGLAEAKDPCDELIVAAAGGVIEVFPRFKEDLQSTINQLVDGMTTKRVRRVVLRDASEGGLVGAGVLAGTVWSLPKG